MKYQISNIYSEKSTAGFTNDSLVQRAPSIVGTVNSNAVSAIKIDVSSPDVGTKLFFWNIVVRFNK